MLLLPINPHREQLRQTHMLHIHPFNTQLMHVLKSQIQKKGASFIPELKDFYPLPISLCFQLPSLLSAQHPPLATGLHPGSEAEPE